MTATPTTTLSDDTRRMLAAYALASEDERAEVAKELSDWVVESFRAGHDADWVIEHTDAERAARLEVRTADRQPTPQPVPERYSPSLDAQQRRLDTARQQWEAANAALLRSDGARRYGDVEHTERERAAQEAFERVIATVEETAKTLDADVEQRATQLDVDPLYRLGPADLQRAVQLRSFVEEESRRLAEPHVLALAGQALAAGDKPAIVCWHRQLRLGMEEFARSRTTGGPRPPAPSVEAMIARLGAALSDPKDAERRAAVERDRQAARGMTMAAIHARFELRGGLPGEIEAQRRRMGLGRA
jgi:hypothetical protein